MLTEAGRVSFDILKYAVFMAIILSGMWCSGQFTKEKYIPLMLFECLIGIMFVIDFQLNVGEK